MPRVKIAEKPHYRFQYATVIRVRDINYGGHLGNDSVGGLLHEARVEVLRALGAREGDLGDGKTGIILADLAIRFLAEGHLFDEIVVESDFGEITERSLRMFHRIRRGETLLALAEVGVVAFSYATRGIGSFPEDFLRQVRPSKSD